jgi:hypothetical protein
MIVVVVQISHAAPRVAQRNQNGVVQFPIRPGCLFAAGGKGE